MTTDASQRSRLDHLYTALRKFGIVDRFELASLFNEEELPSFSAVRWRLDRNTDALPPGINADYLATFLVAEISHAEPVASDVGITATTAVALTTADAEELGAIRTGTTQSREHADRYQNHVRRLLGGLFAGQLTDVGKEVRQFGIGRIDLVYRNSATSGFFDQVARRLPTSGFFIPVECKNEGGDPKPGAFQQLAGRLDEKYGTLGLLACRRVADPNRAVKRCARYLKDNKWMIVLTDADFLQMLSANLVGDTEGAEAPLYAQLERLAHA